MNAIKEESVKSFATEMSAEMEKSTNEMICDGKSTCEELTKFKAELQNEEPSSPPAKGSGRTLLFLGAEFFAIFCFISA